MIIYLLLSVLQIPNYADSTANNVTIFNPEPNFQLQIDSMKIRLNETGKLLESFEDEYYNCFWGSVASGLAFYFGCLTDKPNTVFIVLGTTGMFTFGILDVLNYRKIKEAGRYLQTSYPQIPNDTKQAIEKSDDSFNKDVKDKFIPIIIIGGLGLAGITAVIVSN